MKVSTRLFNTLAMLLAGALSSNAQTSVPNLINYQGVLQDASGVPLPPGDYALTFSIWDSESGGSNPVWGPQQFIGQSGVGQGPKIPVVEGRFNVVLGQVDTAGRQLADVFGAAGRFLEIKVGNNPAISPRQRMLSGPYALRAGNSDHAIVADVATTATRANDSQTLKGFDWMALFPTGNPTSEKIRSERINQIGNIAIGTDVPGFDFPFETESIGLASAGGSLRLQSANAIVFHTGASFPPQVQITSGGSLDFGSRTRQMVNLWGGLYGIGVQANTLYCRSAGGNDDGFAWYRGGAHADGRLDPGGGGSVLMALDSRALKTLGNNANPYVGGGQGIDTISGAFWWVEVGSSKSGVQEVRFRNSADDDYINIAANLIRWGNPGVPRSRLSSDQGGAIELGDGAGVPYIDFHAFDTHNLSGDFSTRLEDIGDLRGLEVYTASGGYGQLKAVLVNACDRSLKQDFQRIEPESILKRVRRLPVESWAFRNSAEIRHLGPTAQDFKSAFPELGNDDRSICTVDADGVALAAIKALGDESEAKDRRIQQLETVVAELKAKLDAVVERMK